jgi:hypothetical protein
MEPLLHREPEREVDLQHRHDAITDRQQPPISFFTRRTRVGCHLAQPSTKALPLSPEACYRSCLNAKAR